MSKKSNKFDFEAALAELEKIVSVMEDGKQSLEDSLQHFERGINLIRQCQNVLKESEQKVQILLEDKTLAPYEDAKFTEGS